ncbi:8763_t:CDS:1, partial [Diversispora eburnea]
LNFISENGNGEIKSRIDYIWILDNLADQLFYGDIISAHLTSQSDHACAIIEIETNIFEKQKPMLKKN